MSKQPGMSPRQRQVADLFVQGLTIKAIARRLEIERGTVDNHLTSLRIARDLPTNAKLLEALRAEQVVGQVYNLNEGLDTAPMWMRVPHGGAGSLTVYDVVRRCA